MLNETYKEDEKQDEKENSKIEEKVIETRNEIDIKFQKYLSEISKTIMSDLTNRISKDLKKVFFVRLCLYTRDFECVSDFFKVYDTEYACMEVLYSFPSFTRKVMYVCYEKDYNRVVNVILNDKKQTVFMIDGKKVEIIFENQEEIDRYERMGIFKKIFNRKPRPVIRQIIPGISDVGSCRLEAH